MSDNPCIVVKGSETEFGRQFLIEYDGIYVVIDGVRCTAEALEAIFVSPRAGRWFSFERAGDTVNVREMRPADVAIETVMKGLDLE